MLTRGFLAAAFDLFTSASNACQGQSLAIFACFGFHVRPWWLFFRFGVGGAGVIGVHIRITPRMLEMLVAICAAFVRSPSIEAKGIILRLFEGIGTDPDTGVKMLASVHVYPRHHPGDPRSSHAAPRGWKLFEVRRQGNE